MEKARRKPGRPPSAPPEERRAKILQAAESVFLAAGFGAANMDDIARLAGMSKRTVYELFGTKEALFSELVDARHGGVPDMNDKPDASEAELVDTLTELAMFIRSPRQIAIQRVIFAEYMRNAERSQNVFSHLARSGQDGLSRWIARQAGSGHISIADPDEAASVLFGMTVGHLHAKLLLLGQDPDLSREVTRQRIARAVRIFLAGTRAPAEASPPAPGEPPRLREDAV